ncbi:MAG TPA: biopolymer transporter ExbD [Chryseolinea sp.]|nr:biopolymer transporter ExbD [Chryseolinea sp.]
MAQLSAPGGNHGARRSIHLDMTPMVDLAFLLLTFFVLTMTIKDEFVLKMKMPEQDSKVDPPVVSKSRVLTVLLGESNQIFYFQGSDPLQSTDFGPTGIRKVLSESMTKRDDLVVLIKPTSKCRYQNLIDIMDEIRIVGLENYFLVKETGEDRALMRNEVVR